MQNNYLNINIKNLYFVILLLVVLDSMHAWFFWSFNRFIVSSIFAFITILIATIRPNMFSFNKRHVIVLLFVFLLARFFAVRGNTNAYLGALSNSLNIIFFISLARQYQTEAINYISKAMGIIIGASVFFWLLFLIGLPLPNSPITFGYSELRDEAQYFYNNHYFFLYFAGNKYMDITNLIPRFSSIILEPSYLGLLMVVLLHINNYNLRKKENIVFLLALALSLSLAGWLLGTFSYTIISLKKSKYKFGIIASIIIALLLFNWFFSTYKNGANPINELILERLKFDDSKGTISGYNRTLADFDFWFENNFLKSTGIFWGSEDYQKYFAYSTNVGWKPYVAQYGFIGLGLYFFFLFYWYYKNKNFLTFGFMLLYIAIFMRGHHEIFWAAFPILYIGGSIILKSKHNEAKNITIQ